MYCLDTNIVVEIIRGNEKVIEKVEKIWDEKIFLTTVTLCELFKGAYGHANYEKKIKVVEEFINNVEIVSENVFSSKLFGYNCNKLRKSGKWVGDFDCLIASIAKANDLIVVTSDKHFRRFDCEVMII